MRTKETGVASATIGPVNTLTATVKRSESQNGKRGRKQGPTSAELLYQQEKFFRENMEKEYDTLAQKHGRLQQSKTEKYMVTVSRDISNKAAAQAEAEGTNIQGLIRRAIYEYLSKTK